MKKITRRKLAAAVLGSAAATRIAAQAPPATPEDDLKLARDRMRATGETLNRQDVPMSTEPAFQFKA